MTNAREKDRPDPLSEPESLQRLARDWRKRRPSLLESRLFERAVWFAVFAVIGVFAMQAARMFFGR